MNSALCFIGSFLNKMLGGRVDTGGRQVGGEKVGWVYGWSASHCVSFKILLHQI